MPGYATALSHAGSTFPPSCIGPDRDATTTGANAWTDIKRSLAMQLQQRHAKARSFTHPHSHSIVLSHGNVLIYRCKFFCERQRTVSPIRQKIALLNFKENFRRFGVPLVSATIGVNRSIFAIPRKNRVIGLAEKVSLRDNNRKRHPSILEIGPTWSPRAMPLLDRVTPYAYSLG